MTERQSEILEKIIKEYVRMAQPVSSQVLEKKKRLGISSATIRNEMQKLTDDGYLLQPYTSAGRVPTDKGYRFFVDNIAGNLSKSIEILMDFEDASFNDSLKFIREITKFLSEESSNLALGYLPQEKILWKEGWAEIFKEPEFKNGELNFNFARMIEELEKEIDNLVLSDSQEIQIYIGQENPFYKNKDFSMIMSRCRVCPEQNSVLMIIGPKRMAYDRNINLLESLIKLIEN